MGRNPFRRGRDYAAAALIAVAVLVVPGVLSARSDIGHTTLRTGPSGVAAPAVPLHFPPSLAEFWSRPSAGTPVPVVAGPTVVTASGGTVAGLDPSTGDQRWSYSRNLGLCSVTTAWSKIVAMYHKATGCSEVTTLDPTTGARGPQRNGDAQLGARLVYDGIYGTTTGPTLLDTWRSDLVQTMEYGTVPDFVNPNRQPRTGCTYGSVAVATGVIGVIERCPNDPGDRLTVYRATAKDADTPSVVFSTVVGNRGTRLIALNDQYAAVVAPGPDRLVVLNAQNGSQVASYPLDLPAQDLNGDPAGLVVPVTQGGGALYWYTGSSTISLSGKDFHPLWTVPDTLGPGTPFAGRYLVPVADALAVYDPGTGAKVGAIGVDRHGYAGTVTMATLGPVVFEQRGATLAALH